MHCCFSVCFYNKQLDKLIINNIIIIVFKQKRKWFATLSPRDLDCDVIDCLDQEYFHSSEGVNLRGNTEILYCAYKFWNAAVISRNTCKSKMIWISNGYIAAESEHLQTARTIYTPKARLSVFYWEHILPTFFSSNIHTSRGSNVKIDLGEKIGDDWRQTAPKWTKKLSLKNFTKLQKMLRAFWHYASPDLIIEIYIFNSWIISDFSKNFHNDGN